MEILWQQTFWLLILEGIYLLLVALVCARVIWDTQSVSKTIAYLILIIFLPIVGVLFYFSFGVNYRKRRIYRRKLHLDKLFKREFQHRTQIYQETLAHSKQLDVIENTSLIRLLSNELTSDHSAVFIRNEAQILINGEQFFRKLIEELKKASTHIHIEFYIFENDGIGNQIKEILIEKAKAGVQVRFIYDDFGSKSIRGKFVKDLKAAGVQVYPFNKIYFLALANRMNYRNHRKIVIIDGHTSFVGGINVSDKYINTSDTSLYWRDTHLWLHGEASYSLQYIFLADWNFCSGENLQISTHFFPEIKKKFEKECPIQIVADGPDSYAKPILYATLHAINKAQDQILLTTPYYVPDESLQLALILASLSGVKVKLMVPKKGDSRFVDLASQSYFEELLEAGVEVYRYTKGFIHAKTFVIDSKIASVGSANLDIRSFDLNFEVTSLLYNAKLAKELSQVFDQDCMHAEALELEQWRKRSKFIKITERLLRLFSPFL